MTDRELLEMAAKAAGHQIDPIDAAHEPEDWFAWNPLTDDGDALRLGVKVRAFGHPDFIRQLGVARFATQEQDDTAAYRRAIVCVAAAIGEQMP